MIPYTQGILLSVLRTALAGRADVGSLQPADLSTMLPYVVVARVPGGSTGADIRFEDAGRVQIDAYADDPKAAVQLAGAAHVALVAAWRRQTVVASTGWLSRVDPVSLPALLPQSDLPAGIYRAQALYVVSSRAAA